MALNFLLGFGIIVILIIVVVVVVLVWWSTTTGMVSQVSVEESGDSNQIKTVNYATYGYTAPGVDESNNTQNLIVVAPGSTDVSIYVDENDPEFTSLALFITQTRTFWEDNYWTLGNEISTVIEPTALVAGKRVSTKLTLEWPTASPHDINNLTIPSYNLGLVFDVNYIRGVINSYFVDITTQYDHNFQGPLLQGGAQLDIWGPSSGSYAYNGGDLVLVSDKRPLLYWTASFFDASKNLIGVVVINTNSSSNLDTGAFYRNLSSVPEFYVDNSIRINGYGSPVPPIPTTRDAVINPGLKWPQILFTELWKTMYVVGSVYTTISFTDFSSVPQNLYVNGLTSTALLPVSSYTNSGSNTNSPSYYTPAAIVGLSDPTISTGDGTSSITGIVTLQPNGTQTITTQVPIPMTLSPSTPASSFNVYATITDSSQLSPGTYDVTFNLTELALPANPGGSPPPQDFVVVVNANSVVIPIVGTGLISLPVYITNGSGVPIGNGYYLATIDIVTSPIPQTRSGVTRGFSRLRELYSTISRGVERSLPESAVPDAAGYVDWFAPGNPLPAQSIVTYSVEPAFINDLMALPDGTDFYINFGVYNSGTVASPVNTLTSLTYRIGTSVQSSVSGSSVQVSF